MIPCVKAVHLPTFVFTKKTFKKNQSQLTRLTLWFSQVKTLNFTLQWLYLLKITLWFHSTHGKTMTINKMHLTNNTPFPNSQKNHNIPCFSFLIVFKMYLHTYISIISINIEFHFEKLLFKSSLSLRVLNPRSVRINDSENW